MSQISQIPLLLIGGVSVAIWLGWRVLAKASSGVNAPLAQLPLMKFDENDVPQRYISETGKLLRDGYRKYLKHGQAFKMRNPADEARPQIILPLKYVDEVKNASVGRLSFPLFSDQSFLLEYTGGPRQAEAAVRAIKINLTKSLGNLVDNMHEECLAAFQERLPNLDDWTGLRVYEIFAFVIARITSRIFVGPELCRNPEWIQLMIGITMDAHMASQTIRATYGPRWRWLAPWRHAGAKRVFANRRKAAQLLLPIYKQKMANDQSADKSADGIQWLLDAHNGKMTLEQLADEQAFISVASIHTSTATLTHLLYDILAHPEYIPELIEEIKESLKDDGKWTKQNLTKLKKLDSFMKESQRLNPIGMVTIQRTAVKPYIFKDGLQIPSGYQISMPSYEINHDADFYPSPDDFDGNRFLKLRENGDINKFQFTSVSDDSINFGAGSHACPGRFFASNEIKLMVAELLMNYDMRFAEGQGRPENMLHDFSIIPNFGAEVFMKKKKMQ